MSLKLIRTNTAEEAGAVAADIFEEQLKKKKDSVLGLATGSTPLPLYRELIRREKEGIIDFSEVKTFNLDEYKGLAPDHPQSYRRFMQENLFDHINIRPENTHVPQGLAVDPTAMCIGYDDMVRQAGLDIQLLGIGHDGHIGFNEPDICFPKFTHEVQLTSMTIEANARFFDSIDDVPKAAFTMGIGTIMTAKKIVMVVSGADKAGIMFDLLHGPVTPQLPASIIQFHNDVVVIGDHAALSRI